MPDYLFVYHGGAMPETEEQRQKEIKTWLAWFDGLGEAVVDGGNPVGMSKTVHRGGKVSHDGGQNPTSGYSVIRFGSIDDAVDTAKGRPHLASNGTIEIAEIIPVM